MRQPARRDRRVEGDGGAEAAEDLLFLWRHAATMSRHQPVREKALARQIFRGRETALLRDRRHLAPDLVEVHRRDRPELGLELAQSAEKPGGAQVGRPGREPCLNAAAALAVPEGVEFSDAGQPGLRERRIDPEWAGLADRRVRAVPRALAQDQAKARVGERAGVASQPGALLEDERGPTPDRFERAEDGHDALLVRRELRERERRQAARERGRVRGREVFVDAPRQHAREMRVRVREAR